jgi:hypothetical protein
MTGQANPAFYLCDAWQSMSDDRRASISAIFSADTAIRQACWRALAAEQDVVAQALALDLLLARQAASRMGDEIPVDEALVRRVAHHVLAADAIAGRDRFGRQASEATHIVALRALALMARPDDAGLLMRVAPTTTQDEDYARAWIVASMAALRESTALDSAPLAARLASIAADDNFDELVRAESVIALDASSDAPAEAMLHDLMRDADGDILIETAAALAHRNALTERERAIVEGLLRSSPRTGTFLSREQELRAA